MPVLRKMMGMTSALALHLSPLQHEILLPVTLPAGTEDPLGLALLCFTSSFFTSVLAQMFS